MKSMMKIFMVVVAALALVGFGCNDKKPVNQVTPTAQTTDKQAAQPAAQPAAKKAQPVKPAFSAKDLEQIAELMKKPEKELWDEALKRNDLIGFEAYLRAYPTGINAVAAKNGLVILWGEKVKELTPEQMDGLIAVIETNHGTIKFKFFPHEAPGHCRNFIRLAESHFYDGTIFHRVIKDFMIQGGDPQGTGMGGPGYTIKAEFNNHPHVDGTVSMARAQDPNSAGSQFFICTGTRQFLDHQYTVFGQVTEGLDVVHLIENMPTGAQDRPKDKQIMTKVTIEGL